MKNNPKTILLVDDDSDFLFQTETFLKNTGFRILTAGGQKKAEEILKKEKPDLAIIDLMMEEKDGGFALAYHIKKKDPGMPVIIVSAVASETGLDFDAATKEEKSWIKADVFLTKPVRYEQLHREIKRLIAGEE
jgi:DNA-binding NtrC family response regulator